MFLVDVARLALATPCLLPVAFHLSPLASRLPHSLHQHEIDLRLLEAHANDLHPHAPAELVLHAAALALERMALRIELEVILPEVGDVHQAVDVELVEGNE